MNRRLALAIALFVPTVASAQSGAMAAMQEPMQKRVTNTDARGIAVGGYDVVSYFMQSAATRGSATHSATIDGATYQFASAANRDAFMAAPQKYIPQYGGYCAMGVAVGKKFDVDPTAFRVVDGKLYLNKDPKVQEMWIRDIPGNITKADAKWETVARRSVDR